MSPEAGAMLLLRAWAIVLAITLAASDISAFHRWLQCLLGQMVGIWLFNDKSLPVCGIFGVLAATIFSFIKHKANIERLRNGTEPKVGRKKEADTNE